MAIFPRNEADKLQLMRHIIAGLIANPTIFPNPPFTPAQLQAMHDNCVALSNACVAKRAAMLQAISAKNVGMRLLDTASKKELRYAELITDFDDAKLKLIGWAGRSPRKRRQPPGQPIELEARVQGEGWLRLGWRKPAEGPIPDSYKIERRKQGEDNWLILAIAWETSARLDHQEQMITWEYRVTANNKAGEGPPSNTVTAVL
jgi:hypothetical protein